jgi:hypothetical protein
LKRKRSEEERKKSLVARKQSIPTRIQSYGNKLVRTFLLLSLTFQDHIHMLSNATTKALAKEEPFPSTTYHSTGPKLAWI